MARVKGGALIIHAGLLKGRADLNATLHTHTVAGMGVAAHKFGLLPINQHAIRFYGEIKYHDFEGFEFDDEMTPKLLRDLEGGQFMILRNHGVLVSGGSVAECVVSHHFLEMAFQGQIAALAAGEGNYTVPSKAACEYGQSQFLAGGNFLTGRQGLGGLPASRRPSGSIIQELERDLVDLNRGERIPKAVEF